MDFSNAFGKEFLSDTTGFDPGTFRLVEQLPQATPGPQNFTNYARISLITPYTVREQL